MASRILDWLNGYDFDHELTSEDLYVSSKCHPGKTSWWIELHLKLRGTHARRRSNSC